MTRRLSRRGFIGLSALGAGAALFARPGPLAAQQKVSKAIANYQDSPKGGERCSECRFFIAKTNMCQRVEGRIAPNGWCMFFAPKS